MEEVMFAALLHAMEQVILPLLVQAPLCPLLQMAPDPYPYVAQKLGQTGSMIGDVRNFLVQGKRKVRLIFLGKF